MARKDERSARLRQALARLAQHSTFNTRRTKRHHAKSLRNQEHRKLFQFTSEFQKKAKRLFRSSSSESAALLW